MEGHLLTMLCPSVPSHLDKPYLPCTPCTTLSLAPKCHGPPRYFFCSLPHDSNLGLLFFFPLGAKGPILFKHRVFYLSVLGFVVIVGGGVHHLVT